MAVTLDGMQACADRPVDGLEPPRVMQSPLLVVTGMSSAFVAVVSGKRPCRDSPQRRTDSQPRRPHPTLCPPKCILRLLHVLGDSLPGIFHCMSSLPPSSKEYICAVLAPLEHRRR